MKLRDWRISEGISSRDLAIRLGTTHATISRAERGVCIPGKAIMVRIYEMSGGRVTANDFFDIGPRYERKEEDAMLGGMAS